MNIFLRMLPALAALWVASQSAVAAESRAHDADEIDFHFRPFGIEPADRVHFGEGHAVIGIDRARHRHDGGHTRTALPMELTLGLPGGFAAMLEKESSPRFSRGEAPNDEGGERGLVLKYSLADIGGIHVAVVAGASRAKGEERKRVAQSLVAGWDTPLGAWGAGYAVERRHPGEARHGREFGVNWFRLWDSGWGLGAELRRGRTPNDESARHATVGIAKKLARNLLLDLAVGRTSGAERERLLTLGASLYF